MSKMKKMGFWSVLALVIGSQVGSGVLMLPANLAPYGILSFFGWLISGAGAIALALVFAKLCHWCPKTGGPHVFATEAFGKVAGFFTGWTYWVISWVSTTAVISAGVGYLNPIIGINSPSLNLMLQIAILFIITAINLKGMVFAGKAEFILTMLKVIPLILMPIIALFSFDMNNFSQIANLESASHADIGRILGRITLLTLWGFVGVESATTPAGSVENPAKVIPRAVVIGTVFVAILYCVNSLGVMGVVKGDILAQSDAPYVDAARVIFGDSYWHIVIAIIAFIICVGTINAWVLASGQIALGLAQDGLLPSVFKKLNQNNAPANNIIISCVGIVVLLIFTLNESLTKQINVIIDFSVICFLFVYLISTLAFLKLLIQNKTRSFFDFIYGVFALFFCLWIIFNTPLTTILLSSAFILSGIPVFISEKRKSRL